MLRIVLLLAVAGPLLAFGMPFPTLLWAFPTRLRRRSVAVTRHAAYDTSEPRLPAMITQFALSSGHRLITKRFNLVGGNTGAA